MPNPILVEVTRGALVESIHRGSIAIADAEGAIRFALGDVETPVYPRSALKPVQALPLVESGAADAFDLSDEEVALACASHSGEPMHTQRVAAWLARIGCGERDLACGPQAPRFELALEEMLRRGDKPTRIHNNCSGKHAGFLTVARHWNVATAGYERADHPVQQAVATSLRELSGVEELPWGVDGCTAPNFALPLGGFARALAKLAGGRTPGAARIVRSMIAHPELVAGTGRTCTALMRAATGRAAVKTGAEGVYAAIVPERGLGIAIKIDDGAARAAETTIAVLLDKLGAGKVPELLHAPVRNTRGQTVGERRPAQVLADLALL
ncbi:MAG: asparaginase [Alphaproteobacteria bacterium]|nr:asparaginase [Alphaproteobacteria bacterium]MDE2630953.1 asparaginase [Alphaproteobacteria bacterium]